MTKGGLMRKELIQVCLNSRRGCRIFFYRWIHDVREISFDNRI